MRTLILILVVLLVFYGMRLLVRRLNAAEEEAAESEPDKQLASPWRAVTIRTGDPACAAARRIEGERFLLNQAPPIPLTDCDVEDCTCTYAHFEDRRSGTERRDAYDLRTGTHRLTDEEKRKGERRGN